MYLTRDEIQRTLSTVEARSAPGSRLIVAYHQPALMLLLLAVIVRRLGSRFALCSRLTRCRTCWTATGFVGAGTAIFRSSDLNSLRRLAMPSA
jgi:hypothetical protein